MASLSSSSSSSSSPTAASAKRTTKEGILSKQGGVRRNWKKRHFVLKHGHLAYFEPTSGPLSAFKAYDTPLGLVNVTVHRAEPHPDKPECFRLALPDVKDKRVYVLNAQTPDNCRAWLAALQPWYGVAVPLTKEFCAALSAGQLRLAYALLDKGSRVASSDGLVSSLVFRPALDGSTDDAEQHHEADANSSAGAGAGSSVDAAISAPQPATVEQLERAHETRQLAMAQLSASAIGGALMPSGGFSSAAFAMPAAATAAATHAPDDSRKWLPKDKRTVSSKEWRAAHPPLNPAVAQWENEPFAAIHFQMCPPSLRFLHGHAAAAELTLQRRGVAGDRRRVVSMPPSSAGPDDAHTASTSSERDQQAAGERDDVARTEEMLRHERSIIDALQRMKVAFGATDVAAANATDSAILAARQNIQQLELRYAAAQMLQIEATLGAPTPTPGAEPLEAAATPRGAAERPALPPKPDNVNALVPAIVARAPTPTPTPPPVTTT